VFAISTVAESAAKFFVFAICTVAERARVRTNVRYLYGAGKPSTNQTKK
jgi:hypothetical protein